MRRNFKSLTNQFLYGHILALFLLIGSRLIAHDKISDLEARQEMAKVLTNLKQYDEAIREYENILNGSPDNFPARIALSKIYFYQGRDEQALTELSKVPEQQMTDDAKILTADIYRKKKEYPAAEKIYTAYLQKNPNDDATRLKLAEMLSWQKQYDGSVREYRLILKNRPGDIQVRRKYAQVLTWMGNNEEAILEWKKTLK